MTKKRPVKRLILTLILNGGIFFSSLGAASPTIPIQRLTLTQERFVKNGVFVSRPSPLDEMILAIVRQNGFQSVNDYAAWLEKTMEYKPTDMVEQWPEADELLKTRSGDCKDFAILTFRVLKVLGYEPHILALTSRSNGHAICAFKYDGKLYWFDNAQLKISDSRDLRELSRELAEKFNYSQTFEIDIKSKENKPLYERT